MTLIDLCEYLRVKGEGFLQLIETKMWRVFTTEKKDYAHSIELNQITNEFKWNKVSKTFSLIIPMV